MPHHPRCLRVPSCTVRVRTIVRQGLTVKVTVACSVSGRLVLLTGAGAQVGAPQPFTCTAAGSATTTFHLSARGRQLARRASLRAVISALNRAARKIAASHS